MQSHGVADAEGFGMHGTLVLFFGTDGFFRGMRTMDGSFDKLHLEGPEAVDVIMADAQDLLFLKDVLIGSTRMLDKLEP